MIHTLSLTTTYLQSFVIRATDGEALLRSHATGFFLRTRNALLLVTNWHVVTGLNPAEPSLAPPMGAPHYLKLTVRSRTRMLTELTVPLYSADMVPLWHEHPDGPAVDVVLIKLPVALEAHFEFVDVTSITPGKRIEPAVAKDVFLLGYPFSRSDMQSEFGENAPYYLPVWKRGSIATEPAVALRDRLVLIDALSRPGMSGAPVFVAQDDHQLGAGSARNQALFKRLTQGDTDALFELDTTALTDVSLKRFQFYGVYSGTIGSTRLAEIALGKCWTSQTLLDVVSQAVAGRIPFHAPSNHEHYAAFFARLASRELITLDRDGREVSRARL